jgi:hypothetical protein
MSQAHPPTFRIGLALAGAVSAGAYSAGVLDFLIEALDAWYSAKARDEPVPRHAVSLEAAVGASAGAMCAALLAIVLPYRFAHVRVVPDGSAHTDQGGPPAANPLYRAWVEAIDARALLGDTDLAAGRLEALLDCTVIDALVAASLAYSASPQPRPYVKRPFVARLTLGNLRGVPYRIDFLGNRPASAEAMREHADWRGFLIGGQADPQTLPAHLRGHVVLPENSVADLPRWRLLGEAAAASGAFPLFLKPRLIERQAGEYACRHVVATPEGGLRPIPPAWRDPQHPPEPYRFAAVDGGVFNNEPFELARELLAGGPGRELAAAPQAAQAAVLMVAPFLSPTSDGAPPPTAPDDAQRLVLPPQAQLAPLVESWIMQARFKPADLALAWDETEYSRFVIAPAGSKAPPRAPYAIAGGALGGFLGFLHADYRRHDYQLGRRNCQRFLAEHFTLPPDNPIVSWGYAPLSSSQLEALRSSDGQLPIVPLVGAVRAQEPLMDWPAGRLAPEALLPEVGRRLDGVCMRYREQLTAGQSAVLRPLYRTGLAAAWRWFVRPRLLDLIRSNLAEALKRQGL